MSVKTIKLEYINFDVVSMSEDCQAQILNSFLIDASISLKYASYLDNNFINKVFPLFEKLSKFVQMRSTTSVNPLRSMPLT